VNYVKLPERVSDRQAIMISDIFPTGWFGADLAEVSYGDTVAVFGRGPVGQFAITSAFVMGAGQVFAVDEDESCLEMARAQGAQIINHNEEDPVGTLFELTGGIGVDRVVEAVDVDAKSPSRAP
jgi:threonine dehydrogenase-like Zn-dependent dehydrogenase